ncbi:MAG TPA: DUF2905 domain-containing protein [Xanthomonadales bacterium]|nr:DUF2905 domain-containing protein [Xanthomonadales bacterium]
MNNEMSKTLIIVGVAIVVIGLIYNYLPKGGSFPKLPGDILIKKDNFSFYFPWVTSILVSILFTIIFYLLNKR